MACVYCDVRLLKEMTREESFGEGTGEKTDGYGTGMHTLSATSKEIYYKPYGILCYC